MWHPPPQSALVDMQAFPHFHWLLPQLEQDPLRQTLFVPQASLLQHWGALGHALSQVPLSRHVRVVVLPQTAGQALFSPGQQSDAFPPHETQLFPPGGRNVPLGQSVRQDVALEHPKPLQPFSTLPHAPPEQLPVVRVSPVHEGPPQLRLFFSHVPLAQS